MFYFVPKNEERTSLTPLSFFLPNLDFLLSNIIRAGLIISPKCTHYYYLYLVILIGFLKKGIEKFL